MKELPKNHSFNFTLQERLYLTLAVKQLLVQTEQLIVERELEKQVIFDSKLISFRMARNTYKAILKKLYDFPEMENVGSDLNQKDSIWTSLFSRKKKKPE